MTKKISLLFICFLTFACSNELAVVESEVLIEDDLESVWSYNQDDENAKDWSIFFAKIVVCPVDECPENIELMPGEIGSVRRCYRNQNEEGIYWDEKTLESRVSQTQGYRKIMTYNINGYNSNLIKNSFKLKVEQFYESVSMNQTALKFRVAHPFEGGDTELSFASKAYLKFIFWLTSSRTKEIFEKNLANIKAALELKSDFKRPYPYEKFCDKEKFYCLEAFQDF